MTQQSTEQPSPDERANVLVLQDSEGNYYAISGRQLAEHRVPDESKADFEKAMSSGEVAGFGPGAYQTATPLPKGLTVRDSFSSQLVQLPTLQRALMQGPPPSVRGQFRR